LIVAYTKGIRLSAIPNSDARSKIKEKLKAPIPKIPVMTNRRIKGLLPLITQSIFERIVVLAAMDLFILTSFTKNTRMRSAMPPGINEIRNIDLISMN
jgi:hypothetical protein